MKVTILCSSVEHPVNAYLQRWIERHKSTCEIELVRSRTDLRGGDILFLISCTEIVKKQDRDAFEKTLVIHASDLPRGRGWSPYVWQIIEGHEKITLSLIEAKDEVDSGDIWEKVSVHIPRHVLWDEINHTIFEAELRLMDYAVNNFRRIEPVPQDTAIAATYYPKRTPKESRIDPEKSIESQFNKIRICDPDRYPAYFDLYGYRYIIRLEKAHE